MKTQRAPSDSLRQRLARAENLSRRWLWGAGSSVSVDDLVRRAGLGWDPAALAGRSILIAASGQLRTARALVALDGIARRMVICPPDLASAQLPFVISKAEVDTVISEDRVSEVQPAPAQLTGNRATEWVLLTSGTSGAPKMIVHTIETLAAPISRSSNAPGDIVWGTFYDIRRYGGLQILLRALLGNGSFVLSSAAEPVAAHLARLAAHRVTHLSGTPSHWRRAMMSPAARAIAPRYIRLSGEIADAGVLQALGAFYPQTPIAHAFASTEAGVAFEVNDGRPGFPPELLGSHGGVEMDVRNDTLRIRSNRVALRYLDGPRPIADEHGFVDTGDVVELRDGRYYFLGRENGVINVGGLKVYPEQVEAVINRHPAVRMSRVRPRRNPITGSLVSADIVLKDAAGPDPTGEVLAICREHLAPYQIPATIRCVAALEVTPAGKLVRTCAM